MSDAHLGNGRTTLHHLDPAVLRAYIERTRWFAGKGRDFHVGGVTRLGVLPGGSPVVVVHLVEVVYDDAAGGRELYQVPLVLYSEPEQRLDHAFVGWWEEPADSPHPGWVHAYDALHDREATTLWLRAFADAAPGPEPTASSGFVVHRLPGHDLDPEAVPSLYPGEQSNSSVFFGEDAIMKVFRKVTPGVNPDIEVHDVLTRAGSDNVAALYGWLELPDGDGEPWQLVMLQQFLRTATDGWHLALGSVRDLFAQTTTHSLEADPGDQVHARDAGGDFAGEAARLGESLRAVHDLLAEHFPVEQAGTDDAAALARVLHQRLDAAVAAVPALAEHRAAVGALYDRVGSLPGFERQRVHGDLHLGQTLRTSKGWKIVDFEGEPAAPLAERTRPDSRWRDVAGMLRSFDYAPRVVERDFALDHPDTEEARDQRAAEWAHRNRNHFLNAYAGGELSPEERLLLDAYTADKAVYETVYETRNRPDWAAIPLRAVAEIGAA